MPRCRLGLTGLLAITLGTLTSAQAPRVVEESGVRGVVLTHEDAPVTAGTVTLQSPDWSSAISAAIDRDGRFRAVLSTAGLHRLTISVPGFAPHRVDVIVPPSRNVALPAIRLIAPTYFRARFVTAAGEALLSPNLRRRFMGAEGMPPGPLEGQGSSVDTDGAITVGPLPRGVTALALDMPALAVTPVRDITVTGGDSVVDAGTITVQPGTVLHVDLIDGTGAPVPSRPITIEPVAPFSALTPRLVNTDKQGRASFDRLAAGRYRVNATAVDPCNGGPRLPASRLVSVNGTGEVHQRIELDGMVRLVVTSPYGPLAGVTASVTPDSGEQPAASPSRGPARPIMMPPRCVGTTDADGRVSFTHVPPGPIRIEVRSGNSTHQRRANVRSFGPELPIAIPNGFLQAQVTNESTGRPVGGAAITWSGDGYRVRSDSNGTGAALLEGVGDGAGSIEVSANGFAADGAKVTLTQSGTYEVTLRPNPPPGRRVRVVGPAGEPVAAAIVELLPPAVLDVGVIAVTDAKGAAVFPNAPPGALSAIASADGFAPVSFSLPGGTDAPVVVTLAKLR